MPSAWQLRLTLRTGCVFKFAERRLSSGEAHYFIVVNRNPLLDGLLFVVCTSNIQGARHLCSSQPRTLVEVLPGEYRDLTLHTAINCNKLFPITLNEFTQRYTTGEVEVCEPLPTKILARIIEAIQLSDQLSEEEKSLV
jgi:hypothetical protein